MSRPAHCIVGADRLTISAVVSVARNMARVKLADHARANVQRCHTDLMERATKGTRIYGLSTGVGDFDEVPIAPADAEAFQHNILRSHAVGCGPPLTEDQVRALVLARITALTNAHSGASLQLVRSLIALLNRRVYPHVPSLGSVGAGDLAPLAHVGLVLIGEGTTFREGHEIPGKIALEAVDLAPLSLRGRDALALVNGNALAPGLGALAAHDAARLIDLAEKSVALGMMALGSRMDSLHGLVVAGRAQAGTHASARRIRHAVATTGDGNDEQLQEPLSTRCAHHVLGATRDALAYATQEVEADLNATSDNPLVFPAVVINNSANFDSQVVAQALDLLSQSIISLAVASERRLVRLMKPSPRRGLLPFLVHPDVQAGLHSGFMMAQKTAAALVAALRMHAIPGAIQSLPSAVRADDFASMGALSVRRLTAIVALAEQIVALELLAAVQAVDITGVKLSGELLELHERVRGRVAVLRDDRPLSDDITHIVTLLRSDSLWDEVHFRA